MYGQSHDRFLMKDMNYFLLDLHSWRVDLRYLGIIFDHNSSVADGVHLSDKDYFAVMSMTLTISIEFFD